MLSDETEEACSTKKIKAKSAMSSFLFPNQPLARQQLSLRSMRDFISLVLTYPMKIADERMLKNWINDVYLAQSCSERKENEHYCSSRNPLRCMEGLIPDDILNKVRHGLRPIFHGNEPRKPKELPASASLRGVAKVIDIILRHRESCLVDGCNSDLSDCKAYHRRHKVCEIHTKSPQVTIGGHKERFCQQCSRLHSLEEFDGSNRSCRRRLDEHYQRRRKSQPEPLTRAGSFSSGGVESQPEPLTRSGSFSSGGVAEEIDVIPQAILNLAIDLAVEQLIQTLLSSNHIHHVRLSTRNNAEKRIVMEKIESALKMEDNMVGISSAFQRILHIDTSKYLSEEVVQVQLEIAKQMELMKAIEDETKYEHVLLKKHIEEEMMHKNHLVLLVDRDGDTKLDPKKLGFPKTGIAGTVVLITTESSTQENDELRREMDLEIMTEDHLLPWQLFLRLVGGDLICSSGVIQNVAAQIVTECGGHLLAIAIIAKWLKNVEDVKFWESALDQLRCNDSSCDRQSTHPINKSPIVMVNAFKNFCWNYLNMKQKHCLTHCLFIPGVRDGKLDHQLTNDWISSLLVESEEEAEDNLREFVDRFILLQFEENGGRYIRLPPETFDILQSLHTLNPSFIVQDGLGLTETPNTELWHNVVKIQLADNNLSELPPSPNCRELKALMLKGNPDLTEMPPDFFVHMPLLRFLDLSYTSVKDLPSSFFNLEQLRELYLKGCQRFMKLPREVGKLKKLEKLDLDETQIIHLPEEIQNLTNLYSLTLCFYEYHGKKGMQYSCPTIIRSGVISELKKLKHLSIDVHPDDERWHDNLQLIFSEIMGLECLQTLSLYIPQVELLKHIPAHIFEIDFRFVVGGHMKRIISGTMPTYEAKFKQSECSLKFVKGRKVPCEIKKLLGFSKGFFLDRHMTINSLSDFEMENLEQLRFCILAECKEMQTIVGGRASNSSKDILPHLLYLSVSYMKSLKSIWEGPASFPIAFGMLKSLSLHACPSLTTIFTLDFLINLSLLQELIVNDCPKVSSLISHQSSKLKSQIFLPRLRKVFLLYLPELISISNGLHIGPKLEIIVCYDCPKLQRLSNMELSSENLVSIKGETTWWEALEWCEVGWGKAGRPSKFNTIFSSINEVADIISQLGMYNDDGIHDDSNETVGEPCQVFTENSTVTENTDYSHVTKYNYGNSSLAVGARSKSSSAGIKKFKRIMEPGQELDQVLDDGYSWRKYGQKDILGTKFPRGYYRCTHRNVQGCRATKQIQRSDENPLIFEIKYKGVHTCSQSRLSPAASDDGYSSRLSLAALDDSHVMENIYDDSVINTEKDICKDHFILEDSHEKIPAALDDFMEKNSDDCDGMENIFHGSVHNTQLFLSEDSGGQSVVDDYTEG